MKEINRVRLRVTILSGIDGGTLDMIVRKSLFKDIEAEFLKVEIRPLCCKTGEISHIIA